MPRVYSSSEQKETWKAKQFASQHTKKWHLGYNLWSNTSGKWNAFYDIAWTKAAKAPSIIHKFGLYIKDVCNGTPWKDQIFYSHQMKGGNHSSLSWLRYVIVMTSSVTSSRSQPRSALPGGSPLRAVHGSRARHARAAFSPRPAFLLLSLKHFFSKAAWGST